MTAYNPLELYKKVYTTICEMINDRNYYFNSDIINYDFKQSDFDDNKIYISDIFKIKVEPEKFEERKYTKDEIDTIKANSTNYTKVCIILLNNKTDIERLMDIFTENVKNITYLCDIVTHLYGNTKKYFEKLLTDSDNDYRLILVGDIDKTSKKHLELYEKIISVKNMEFLPLKTFVYNVTKHELQPKFNLITNQTIITNIYNYYSANPSLMGTICYDDPINIYYGGEYADGNKKGHIYEIIRDGVTLYYRKVSSKRMNI